MGIKRGKLSTPFLLVLHPFPLIKLFVLIKNPLDKGTNFSSHEKRKMKRFKLIIKYEDLFLFQKVNYWSNIHYL